jgi:putative SOS response-associated peptidase YedK
MEYIQNTKKRMPLILSREDKRRRIDPNLTKAEIKELMQPLDDSGMETKIVE